MLSLSNVMCDQISGTEELRYGHRRADASRTDATPRPVVVWALTKACNLRCVHCYASATTEPTPGELTDDQGRALLEDLKSFNVPAVLFSGGEPLVRKSAVDMIEYARRIGLRCTLSTNGLLIDDRVADRLAGCGLQYVGISIDGVEARHDKLRGQKGAFAETWKAIDRCRSRGIKVGVRFTVHALNEADLENVFDLCDEHAIDRLCVYHLAYAGRGANMEKVDLTSRETRWVMDRILARVQHNAKVGRNLELLTVGNHADAAYVIWTLEQTDPARAQLVKDRLRGTGGNRSGQNIAAVDPEGGVHYDQFSWHYTCGSVKETPFSKIWTDAADPRLAILRNRRTHLPPRCQACRFLDICNGNLRTRAESSTGDWLGQDPGCYLPDEALAIA
jgi:Fe-coproporphyrin III synthase